MEGAIKIYSKDSGKKGNKMTFRLIPDKIIINEKIYCRFLASVCRKKN